MNGDRKLAAAFAIKVIGGLIVGAGVGALVGWIFGARGEGALIGAVVLGSLGLYSWKKYAGECPLL